MNRAVYRVEWITDAIRLEQLREPWDELAEARRLPFLRPDWLVTWWEAFHDDRSLRACALWDGDQLAALFPLFARGARLQALANVHSPVFVPLARDAAALSVLLRTVAESPETELAVEALPADDPATAALCRACESAGRLALVEPQHVSPVVELGDDVAEYRASLHGHERRELDRRRRKLEREHEVAWILGPPQELESVLDEAFALEAEGWKGGRHTAILSSPETEAFYRAVARRFDAGGRLWLARLVVDGRLAAFRLCLVDLDRMWLLKGGYDERLARYGPGTLLALALIERCFEAGLEGCELLGDDEPWKGVFATGRRSHCVVRGYRRTPAGAGRFVYRRSMRPRLRRAYRYLRPPSPRR